MPFYLASCIPHHVAEGNNGEKPGVYMSQIYKTPDRKGFVFKYGLKIQNVSCVIFLGGKNKIKI